MIDTSEASPRHPSIDLPSAAVPAHEKDQQMKRKLNATQQWMADHPNDKPCPVGFAGAAAWRRARGLNKAEQIKWLRSRLDADKDPWIVAQTAKLESM
jgi:hypothetical protein